MVRVLPTIDLKEELGPKPQPEDAYEVVTGKMQRALDRLDDERAVPIVGSPR